MIFKGTEGKHVNWLKLICSKKTCCGSVKKNIGFIIYEKFFQKVYFFILGIWVSIGFQKLPNQESFQNFFKSFGELTKKTEATNVKIDQISKNLHLGQL